MENNTRESGDMELFSTILQLDISQVSAFDFPHLASHIET